MCYFSFETAEEDQEEAAQNEENSDRDDKKTEDEECGDVETEDKAPHQEEVLQKEWKDTTSDHQLVLLNFYPRKMHYS